MTALSPSQVESILIETLPEECELAGESHVATVSMAAAHGETVPLQTPSQAGLRSSPEATMLAIAAAANFIKVCIDIYFMLKKSKETKPSKDDVISKAMTQSAGVGESAAKLAAAVYKALAQSP
jgi:hypothetical protein